MNEQRATIEITADELTTWAKKEYDFQSKWYINPIEALPYVITEAIRKYCEHFWIDRTGNHSIWGTNIQVLEHEFSLCNDAIRNLKEFNPETDIPAICHSFGGTLVLDTHLNGDVVCIDNVEIVQEEGNDMKDDKETPIKDYNEVLSDILKAMEERNRLLNRVIDNLSRIANRI